MNKTHLPILEYCAQTGIAERTVRDWLDKGLPCIFEQVPGKRGRPRILIDPVTAGNYRVLYARPTSFAQMVKAANRQKENP